MAIVVVIVTVTVTVTVITDLKSFVDSKSSLILESIFHNFTSEFELTAHVTYSVVL